MGRAGAVVPVSIGGHPRHGPVHGPVTAHIVGADPHQDGHPGRQTAHLIGAHPQLENEALALWDHLGHGGVGGNHLPRREDVHALHEARHGSPHLRSAPAILGRTHHFP